MMRALLVVLLFSDCSLAHGALALISPVSENGLRRRVACNGKKKKRVDREAEWAARKAREAAEAKRRAGRATHLEPSALSFAGCVIEEDHRHEQFFFSEATLKGVVGLIRRFERPLLLCAPSVAAALDSFSDQQYLLLDRDTRFEGAVRFFHEYNLLRPSQINFESDLLFIDPPFANVTPLDLAAAANMLIADCESAESFPILIGYNRKRGAELATAFAAFGHLRPTTTVFEYRSGVMPDSIILFANDAAIRATGLVVGTILSSD